MALYGESNVRSLLISAYIESIFLKIHISQSPRMSYKKK